MSERLDQVAQELVAPKKGILAADESLPSIIKKFAKIGLNGEIEENRRAWRDLLLTSSKIGNYISGVILFEETTNQSTSNGVPFVEWLAKNGIHPGIKVDQGLQPFGGYDEQTTKGLDGLEERSKLYVDKGLIFAKARSVYKITDNTPTDELIRENAKFQAKYAAIAQAAGLVPIVEPEVLVSEGTHSLLTSKNITIKVLKSVFDELKANGVDPSKMLLKPNMILPGKDSGLNVADSAIAWNTVDALVKSVPREVPGILFLSGG